MWVTIGLDAPSEAWHWASEGPTQTLGPPSLTWVKGTQPQPGSWRQRWPGPGPRSGLCSTTPTPDTDAALLHYGGKSALLVPTVTQVIFNSRVGGWNLGLFPHKMGLNLLRSMIFRSFSVAMSSLVWEEKSRIANQEAGTCWRPVILTRPALSASPPLRHRWAGWASRSLRALRPCACVLGVKGHQLLGCPWGLAGVLCSGL